MAPRRTSQTRWRPEDIRSHRIAEAGCTKTDGPTYRDAIVDQAEANKQIKALGGAVSEHGAWLEEYAHEKLASRRYIIPC